MIIIIDIIQSIYDRIILIIYQSPLEKAKSCYLKFRNQNIIILILDILTNLIFKYNDANLLQLKFFRIALFNFYSSTYPYLNHFFNKNVQQQQQTKQEELLPQVKNEDLSQQHKKKVVEQQKPSSSDDKKIHIFPGQSKNYYKNMSQKIVKFIFEHFQDDERVMNDSHIKKFIKIPSQSFNRDSILKLKKSKFARKILRLFFANLKWVRPFISQNKAELSLYFRYNKQLYCPQKSLQQNQSHQVKEDCIKQEE
ncbi:unnamed protein product [Paramecium octaurelia]|uniref:Uncharacterized protein n=1 Tax=Paramecium octaurelia TaxID=43137 RepID=A0A8S1T8S3_PAROT|nr:unnamed protein product [Paramecium octaurelia]